MIAGPKSRANHTERQESDIYLKNDSKHEIAYKLFPHYVQLESKTVHHSHRFFWVLCVLGTHQIWSKYPKVWEGRV